MIERSDIENLIDELLRQARELRSKGDNRKAHGIDHAIAEMTKLLG